MMDPESWKVAHTLLIECAHALFESMGVKLTVAAKQDLQPVRAGERVATFIGFSGTDMRGAITMDLPIGLVARVHPSLAQNRALSEAELCDWAGELANQLLGRLKNALAKHAVMLQMSTPSTAWGRMSHATNTAAAGWLELHLAAGDEMIYLYFDAVALVPLDLTKPIESAEGEPQAEGDMMLFF
jgi:chemotaxis protein CheX